MRMALSNTEFEELNKQLLAQFTRLDFTGIRTVHVFLPIAPKREPDTFILIDWLQQQHPEIQLLVSKSNFEQRSMSLHPYLGPNNLQIDPHGIPEPQQAEQFSGVPDLVLVPLLAFDCRGYRVGYGKGFYDRYLAEIETQKVGLSFFAPTDTIEDIHPEDIRLDLCITPTEIFTFA